MDGLTLSTKQFNVGRANLQGERRRFRHRLSHLVGANGEGVLYEVFNLVSVDGFLQQARTYWLESSGGGLLGMLRACGVNVSLHERDVLVEVDKCQYRYTDDFFFSKSYALFGEYIETLQTDNPFMAFSRLPSSLFKLWDWTGVDEPDACTRAQKELARLRLLGALPDLLVYRLQGASLDLPQIALRPGRFNTFIKPIRRTYSWRSLPVKRVPNNRRPIRLATWIMNTTPNFVQMAKDISGGYSDLDRSTTLQVLGGPLLKNATLKDRVAPVHTKVAARYVAGEMLLEEALRAIFTASQNVQWPVGSFYRFILGRLADFNPPFKRVKKK